MVGGAVAVAGRHWIQLGLRERCGRHSGFVCFWVGLMEFWRACGWLEGRRGGRQFRGSTLEHCNSAIISSGAL